MPELLPQRMQFTSDRFVEKVYIAPPSILRKAELPDMLQFFSTGAPLPPNESPPPKVEVLPINWQLVRLGELSCILTPPPLLSAAFPAKRHWFRTASELKLKKIPPPTNAVLEVKIQRFKVPELAE